MDLIPRGTTERAESLAADIYFSRKNKYRAGIKSGEHKRHEAAHWAAQQASLGSEAHACTPFPPDARQPPEAPPA